MPVFRNFEQQFPDRTKTRLARNFAKTRFRRFPTFHFSTPKIVSKLWTAVYPPRMALIDLKLWENAFQAIPDISFFNVEFFFETSNGRLPPNMAPIGAKLCQNAFQVIPDISFFDAHKHFWRQNFCRKKFSSTPQKNFQLSACFGGAVQVYTPLSNADRKFIARHIGFSLLRPLAEE